MKLFLQKSAKFSSAGGSAPQTPVPPEAGGFVPKPPASGGWGLRPQDPHWPPAAVGSAPSPQTAPPITNSWLRAWARGEQGATAPPNFYFAPQIISVESHFYQKPMHIVPKYITLPPKACFVPPNDMEENVVLA